MGLNLGRRISGTELAQQAPLCTNTHQHSVTSFTISAELALLYSSAPIFTSTLPINLLLTQPRHLLIHLGISAPRALYMPSKCVPPNYVPITLFYFETESYYISQAPA